MAQDHFVHRFTHRVVRGLLLAVGRPDGRLYSQSKMEAATLLSLLQVCGGVSMYAITTQQIATELSDSRLCSPSKMDAST